MLTLSSWVLLARISSWPFPTGADSWGTRNRRGATAPGEQSTAAGASRGRVVYAIPICLAISMGIVGTGCATTSATEEQRQAQSYQRNSDAAAKSGQYEIAGQQQRKAQDSQNKAIMKSMDEGKSVPRVSDAADRGHQQQ
jgi:hypothetical protein